MAQVHHVLTRRDLGSGLGRWFVHGRLDWREWDGEFVVRHDETAATYLLSALAGDTLEAMHEGASCLDEIAALVFQDSAPSNGATAALAAAFADPAEGEQRLLVVLAELERLGLARRELV
jgi:hypothetical protein